MAKEIKIRVIEVKEVTTKNGNKFNAYKTVDKRGKKLDLRFTKEVTLLPKMPCTIIVDDDKCNVSTNREYPILWVQEVKRIEESQRKSNVSDYIGDYDEEDPVEFPF